MEPGLIDDYVAALREHLRWRRDVDDLADEVADHLYERADCLVAQGVTPDEAQRRTLTRFGDVRAVARSMAENDSGQLAVPSRATRLAGIASIAGSAAWVASIVAALAGGHMDLLVPWSLQRYQIWTALLMAALALTTVAVAGALLRTGRLATPTGVAALVVGVLLVAAMVPAGWAVTIVSAPLGLAVLAAVRDNADDSRVVRPVRGLAVWLVGAVALVMFDEVIPIGPVDGYGDHQLAWVLPFVGCALATAVVLAVVGVRLRAERPADVDDLEGLRPVPM